MTEKPVKCVENHIHSEFSGEMENVKIKESGDEFSTLMNLQFIKEATRVSGKEERREKEAAEEWRRDSERRRISDLLPETVVHQPPQRGPRSFPPPFSPHSLGGVS